MNKRNRMARAAGKSSIAVAFVLLLLAGSTFAQSAYVWGDASATAVSDMGMTRYWEYCITLGWNVSEYGLHPYGMSHVSLILGLEECLADCGGRCFVLPDTVGIGTAGDACDLYFYAELDLKGDPTVPLGTPTLKFEPYPASCEPGATGTAAICFYSLIPPESGESEPGSIWIKFSTYTEEGTITGMLPSCRGTAANETSTWGSIKRLFK
jgi:hypothetical protein